MPNEDSNFGGSFFLFQKMMTSRATQHSNVCFLRSQLIEGNGYETRQISLLYVIVLFFALDPAQNTIVVYSVPWNQPTETCWLRNSCIVYERKTKDCAGSWTFQHKSWHLCLLLLCLPGFITSSQSHDKLCSGTVNLVYLDNFASYVVSHFVNPEAFTRGFGVCLCLFKPRKKQSLLKKRFMIYTRTVSK